MIEKINFVENFELIYVYFEIYVFKNDQRSYHQIFDITKKNSFMRKIISQQNRQTMFQLLNVWLFKKSMFRCQKLRQMRKRKIRKKRLFNFKNLFQMRNLRKFARRLS